MYFIWSYNIIGEIEDGAEFAKERLIDSNESDEEIDPNKGAESSDSDPNEGEESSDNDSNDERRVEQ